MGLGRDEVLRLLLSGRAMVLAYIQSIARDRHLAEDIFQEISIVALNKRASIQDEVHFRAWIRRAARLETMNVLRREKKSPRALSEPVLQLLEGHWDNHDDDWSEQRVEALRGCLGTLTSNSRKLVRLRYSEGTSGKQLAEILGKPVNTIYVALARIHRKLGECVRRKLGKEGFGRV
jgi:RNA polymerase sigma-70 factor (ECF subfamily)